MNGAKIRPAELTTGESVVVLNKAGELLASGAINSIDPKRFGGVMLSVAGMAFDLSTWDCEFAVVKADDYEKQALPIAQGKWMEVLGRKCRHVRSELPDDVREKALALARELECLIDPFIAKTDEGRNVDFKSFEALRGSHALSESACVTEYNRQLFSNLNKETTSQAVRVYSKTKDNQ